MSRTLVTLPPGSTVGEAATVMATQRVGSLLIVEGDRLVAIFSERDLVRAVSSDAGAAAHDVADWMTRQPQVVSPDTDAETARELMLSGHFRHLPVVDEDRLVGMLSMRDLAAAGSEG